MTDKKHDPADPKSWLPPEQVDPAKLLDVDPFADKLADALEGIERTPEQKAAELARMKARLEALGRGEQ